MYKRRKQKMTVEKDEFAIKAENAIANKLASNIPFIKKALANADFTEKGVQKLKVKLELDIEKSDNGVINMIPKLSANVTHKHEDVGDIIIVDPNTPDLFESDYE